MTKVVEKTARAKKAAKKLFSAEELRALHLRAGDYRGVIARVARRLAFSFTYVSGVLRGVYTSDNVLLAVAEEIAVMEKERTNKRELLAEKLKAIGAVAGNK